ncbi:MAG: hypothetical protein JO142_02225 [Burkholderiales bacterium]|nr:hypothetical protein [Burkholderiales bacterium]
MADITDVGNALVAAIAGILYPNGTAQPSVTGVPTMIYAGWPTASRLDNDLAGFSNGQGGKIHVTVFPTNVERNTTRYTFQGWIPQTVGTPTVVLTQAGQQVTVSGTPPAAGNPQNVVIFCNKLPYVYAAQQTDTLSTIATALSTLIAAAVPGVSNSGPVITFPNSARIGPLRVGYTGTAIREVRRQERQVRITIWADTPANRDVTTQAIDVALAQTEFITLPDTFQARVIYRSSFVDDMVQKANLYRRDLVYAVEYATTAIQTQTAITQIQENVSNANIAGSPVTTIYE